MARPPKVVWHRYAYDVVEGKILAGPLVRLACERHLRDLKDGRKRGLSFDEDRARHIMTFFSDYLKHGDGAFAGEAFELMPFQQFKTACLFGWLGPDGNRRFRTCYNEEGKGNGKTPWGAGITNYGLIADSEHAAEIYWAATALNQASIGFRDAKLQVEASPALLDELEVGVGNIAHIPSGSFMRAISSEKRGLDGKRPHIAVIDELMEHPSPIVVDKMKKGTKTRRQSLVIELTNSGYDRETVCWRHHEMSKRVLEAAVAGEEIDDSWFAYVCGLDEGDIPERDKEGRAVDPMVWLRDHPELWVKANPGLGHDGEYSRLLTEYVRKQIQEAIGMPSNRAITLRLTFCQWTESHVVWIPVERWDACEKNFEEEDLAGMPCFGGLDLSTTTDLTAFALVFPPEDYEPEAVAVDSRGEISAPAEEEPAGMAPLEPWHVLIRAWCPEEKIRERMKAGSNIPWDLWVEEGWLTSIPGDIIDDRIVMQDILKLLEEFQVVEIGYDPWNAHQLVTEMTEALGKDKMVPVRQGFVSLSAPSKAFEAKVRSKVFLHQRNPLFRHCLLNTVREEKAGLIKPSKDHSTGRIDLIAATITALSRAILVPAGSGMDHYNDHDLFVLG